jgi:hypothetical protein
MFEDRLAVFIMHTTIRHQIAPDTFNDRRRRRYGFRSSGSRVIVQPIALPEILFAII